MAALDGGEARPISWLLHPGEYDEAVAEIGGDAAARVGGLAADKGAAATTAAAGSGAGTAAATTAEPAAAASGGDHRVGQCWLGVAGRVEYEGSAPAATSTRSVGARPTDNDRQLVLRLNGEVALERCAPSGIGCPARGADGADGHAEDA